MDGVVGQECSADVYTSAGKLSGLVLVVKVEYVILILKHVMAAVALDAHLRTTLRRIAHRLAFEHLFMRPGKGMDIERALIVGDFALEGLHLFWPHLCNKQKHY